MDKYIVHLTETERADLLEIIRKGKAPARKITYARILLAADETHSEDQSLTDQEISRRLHVSAKTVYRARKAFVEQGLKALERKPLARRKPRKITGDEEARLVQLCCSKAPNGRQRWTLKLLADRLVTLEIVDEISPQTVSRVLKKTN